MSTTTTSYFCLKLHMWSIPITLDIITIRIIPSYFVFMKLKFIFFILFIRWIHLTYLKTLTFFVGLFHNFHNYKLVLERLLLVLLVTSMLISFLKRMPV